MAVDWNKALPAGLAGLEGALGITGMALDSARPANFSYYQGLIDSAAPGYGTNYYDNTQVLNAYQPLPQFNLDVNELNPTIGQSIGRGLTGALTGAKTGFDVAGVPGAIVGTVLGGGAVALGDIYGRRGNALNVDLGKAEYNNNLSLQNLSRQNAADQAHDHQFGQMYATRKADGGKIERKAVDLKSWADGVLSAQKRNHVTHSAGLVHRKCNGGTMVRLKMK